MKRWSQIISFAVMARFQSFVIVLAAFASSSVEGGAKDRWGDFTKAYPLERIQVYYPLMARDLVTGFAEVLFEIDENGNPRDYVVLRETHRFFSQVIIDSVKKTLFQPATVDGQPVASQFIYKNHFRFRGGAAIWKAGDKSPLAKALEGKVPLMVRTLTELDERPIRIETVAPEFPKSMIEKGIIGGVLVEFYIDKNGDVKAPRALSTSGHDFTQAAITAIRQWKFSPPLMDGKPVCAIAQQQISFGEF